MANSFDNDREANHMIGKKLRLARKMKSMSLAKLSELFGISYQQLQKYEKGENRISAARLMIAAQVLEQPITFFYDWIIHDLSPHIGYRELKAAYQLTNVNDEEIKSYLIDLIEQMSH